jgi:hypothetical protein
VKVAPKLRFRWVCTVVAKSGTVITITTERSGQSLALARSRVGIGGEVSVELTAPGRSERVWFSATTTKTLVVVVRSKTGAIIRKRVERRMSTRLVSSRIEV